MEHLEAVMNFQSMFMGEPDECAYPDCSCHTSGTGKGPTKDCSACGIVSYCSKAAQKADWPRHKKLCTRVRDYKHENKKLSFKLKETLNSITFFELPNVANEYFRRFSNETGNYRFIKGGMACITSMVSNTMQDLHLKGDTNIHDVYKRWHDASDELKHFIRTADPGDIFERKYSPYTYDGVPQQFRYVPLPQPVKLVNGTTIVDFNAVDFGIAFDSIETLQPGDRVTVITYDMEPFCVAKTMVMMAMIHDPQVKPRSVLEVWLNSLWTENTFKCFKKATKSILKDDATSEKLDEKVRVIIEYWNKEPRIAPSEALQFQVRALNDDFRFVAKSSTLTDESDRVAYIRYHFTKALWEDRTHKVGSIVMNTVEPDIGIDQSHDNCFEVAPSRIYHMMYEYLDEDSTVIGRTKAYFERSMQKFMTHVRNGTLVFTPKLGTVSESNHALINEVRSAEPSIISWPSNIVDYTHPKTFHKMAKQMSCGKTIHYIYSQNWTTRVYGTDILEVSMNYRMEIYATGLRTIENGLRHMHGFTKQGLNHNREVCTVYLGRELVKKFFQYFFKGEEVNCSCFGGETPLKYPFPFDVAFQTAFVKFAYKNTGIDFGLDNFDFKEDIRRTAHGSIF